jgi:hypothetical protein
MAPRTSGRASDGSKTPGAARAISPEGVLMAALADSPLGASPCAGPEHRSEGAAELLDTYLASHSDLR